MRASAMDAETSDRRLPRLARAAWRALPWVWGLGFLYYATPLAVVTVLLCVVAALVFLRGRRKTALGAFVAALACGLWHLEHDYVRRSEPLPDVGPGVVRVAFWNAGRGHAGWTRVEQEIRAFDADVVALTEAGTDAPDRRAAWEAAFPDHQHAYFGSGMMLFARGAIASTRKLDFQEDAKAALVRLVVEGRTMNVLLVDVKRLALTPRNDVFAKLAAALADLRERSLVVLGDFNTPRDSAFFDPWRDRFAHAFEAAGEGHDATWPLPLPVLAIDHVWCAPDVRALRCEQPWTGASDHRPVVVDLYVRRH
jgi:endonuclease/exonuclease/phosphatase family metal-dependent hydrolase